MSQIPRDNSLDNTLALLREGNTFIAERCRRYDSEVFETRLMLQKVICMSGEQAARLFYDNELFKREGAAPTRLQKTLFGQGGVQVLDGEAHRIRKRLFMDLMTPEDIAEMASLGEAQWNDAVALWQAQDEIELLSAVQDIHFRAVCQWAGVPLEETEFAQRCEEMTEMIDGAPAVGWRHWKARRARSSAEAWVAGLVEQVRNGTLKVDERRALSRISWHREETGELLEPKVAAVEVLNLLRPTVAVARFVTFAALALHEHRHWRERLQVDDAELEPFVQEVRRYYAFFPFIAARTRQDFDWQGYRFSKNTRVLLDLYGTNRDPRTWTQPETFHPERFHQSPITAFNFIPQGGGEYPIHHRCPGEWFTIELMKVAVKQLTRAMRYEVPEQDLNIDWSRIPIVPESRFVISRVSALPSH